MTAAPPAPVELAQAGRASPFVGLVPYAEGDAQYFFGRRREREVVSANLLASRLTIFYGPSGVGKSSVLRAAVVPELERQAQRYGGDRPAFHVVAFSTWRDDPVAGLDRAITAAVAGSGDDRPPMAVPSPPTLPALLRAWTERLESDLLIILDQFEEYFLYHDDGVGGFDAGFPDAVNDPTLGVNFLVSIREDGLARLDRFKGRIPSLFSNYLRIDHLRREAARAAITGPVEEYNRGRPGAEAVTVEPALVDAVLGEVRAGSIVVGERGTGRVEAGDGEGDWPIETSHLQLVMRRLWHEDAGGGTLRVATLERLGGADTIVRTHLDDVMAACSEADRGLAARAFNHLVTPSGTKIALGIDDLAAYAGVPAGDLEPVLRRLAGSDVRVLRHVAPPPDRPDVAHYEIFHDVLAAAVLDWRSRYERAAAEEDLQRRLALARRRTFRAAAVAVVSLAVVVAMVVLLVQVRRQQRTNRAQELTAAAGVKLPVDPADSARDALAAVRSRATPPAERALRDALGELHVRAVLDAGGPVTSATIDAAGRRVLTLANGRVRLWDAGTFREVADGSALAAVRSVAQAGFDGGGRVVTERPGALQYWDPSTGSLVETHDLNRFPVVSLDPPRQLSQFVSSSSEIDEAGNRSETRSAQLGLVDPVAGTSLALPPTGATFVNSLARSPSAPVIAYGNDNGELTAFDVATGASGVAGERLEAGVRSLAVSPDGETVVAGGRDGRVVLWRWRAGPGVEARAGYEPFEARVAFSPDGAQVLTWGRDEVQASPLVPLAFSGPLGGATRPAPRMQAGAEILDAAFSPDGRRVVTGAADGTVHVWAVGSNALVARLAGHRDAVTSVAFSSDGATVLSAGRDGTARVWALPAVQVLRSGGAGVDAVLAARLTGDGRHVVAAGVGGGVRRWEEATGRAVDGLPVEAAVIADVAVSADGGRAAVAASEDDGSSRIEVWEWGADAPLAVRPAVRATAVAFGGDGDRVIYADAGGVHLWDWAGAEEQSPILAPGVTQPALAVAPDGSRVAVSNNRVVELWDAGTGRRTARLTGHRGLVLGVAFSRDGRLVAGGGADRTVRVWDAGTGRRVALLGGAGEPLAAVAFGSGDAWLVAGSTSGRLVTWRQDSPDAPARVPLHSGRVNTVAVHPGRAEVLTAGDDGTVRLSGCAACGDAEAIERAVAGRLAALGDAAFGPGRATAALDRDAPCIDAFGDAADCGGQNVARVLAAFDDPGARDIIDIGTQRRRARAACELWASTQPAGGLEITARFEVREGNPTILCVEAAGEPATGG